MAATTAEDAAASAEPSASVDTRSRPCNITGVPLPKSTYRPRVPFANPGTGAGISPFQFHSDDGASGTARRPAKVTAQAAIRSSTGGNHEPVVPFLTQLVDYTANLIEMFAPEFT